MGYMELKIKAYKLVDTWLVETKPENRKFDEICRKVRGETGFGDKLIEERLKDNGMKRYKDEVVPML
jgi:hypothetical protein